MDDERKIRILRNALDTILSEAKEPIIQVYAKSALDETAEPAEPVIDFGFKSVRSNDKEYTFDILNADAFNKLATFKVALKKFNEKQ